MDKPLLSRHAISIRVLTTISMALAVAAVTASPSANAAPVAPKVAGGGYHTCGITSVGGLECWGQNSDGQLGDGTKTLRFTPVGVFGLSSGVSTVQRCAL